MNTIVKTLALIIMLLPLSAQAEQPSLFDMFGHTTVLEIELQLNMDTLHANVSNNREQPALFRFKNSDGSWVELLSEVRARGRFRRRTCDFPPLRIDFSKKDLRERGLEDFDDLKLVTHCMEGESGKEAVLREYLSYELYSQLTVYAYRAQLVQVTYVDAWTGSRLTNYGILLEDTDELAARMGSKECEECYGMSAVDFDAQNLHIHSLFQYMIGNMDWSVPMVRNIKVMKPADGGKYWLAPYDFDFSGIVDAPYAIPNPDIGQRTVGDRVYQGPVLTAAEMEEVASHFKQQKIALLETVKQFDELSKRSRREIWQYLRDFYDDLESGVLHNEITASTK